MNNHILLNSVGLVNDVRFLDSDRDLDLHGHVNLVRDLDGGVLDDFARHFNRLFFLYSEGFFDLEGSLELDWHMDLFLMFDEIESTILEEDFFSGGAWAGWLAARATFLAVTVTCESEAFA